MNEIDKLNKEIKTLKESIDKEKLNNKSLEKNYNELNEVFFQQNKIIKNIFDDLEGINIDITKKIEDFEVENNEGAIKALEQLKSDIEIILNY